MAAQHVRIETLGTRRRTVVEARGERYRLADVALLMIRVADGGQEQTGLQRISCIRTGRLTPFQCLQEYERHEEPQLKRRGCLHTNQRLLLVTCLHLIRNCIRILTEYVLL